MYIVCVSANQLGNCLAGPYEDVEMIFQCTSMPGNVVKNEHDTIVYIADQNGGWINILQNVPEVPHGIHYSDYLVQRASIQSTPFTLVTLNFHMMYEGAVVHGDLTIVFHRNLGVVQDNKNEIYFPYVNGFIPEFNLEMDKEGLRIWSKTSFYMRVLDSWYTNVPEEFEFKPVET